MIRFLSAVLFSISSVFYCSAQDSLDLFSAESTQKFANHLFKTGQYEEAGNEYLRLYYLDSSKQHLLLMSVSFRKAGQPQKSLYNLQQVLLNSADLDAEFGLEFGHVLMALGHYQDLIQHTKENKNLNKADAQIIRAAALLQLQNWKAADSILQDLPDNHQVVHDLTGVAKTGLKLQKKEQNTCCNDECSCSRNR